MAHSRWCSPVLHLRKRKPGRSTTAGLLSLGPALFGGRAFRMLIKRACGANGRGRSHVIPPSESSL